MTRNLDYRVEVTCPIYDQQVKKEMKDILDIQWRDNVKARLYSPELTNDYKKLRDEEPLRSQYATYDNLLKKLKQSQ